MAFKAIKLTDLGKPEEEIEEWIRTAAGPKWAKADVFQKTFDVEDLVKNLKLKVELKRTTPARGQRLGTRRRPAPRGAAPAWRWPGGGPCALAGLGGT